MAEMAPTVMSSSGSPVWRACWLRRIAWSTLAQMLVAVASATSEAT